MDENIEFFDNKYDPIKEKMVRKKQIPRQKIIELGGSLITNPKEINKNTVDIIKKTINRGK
jgi:hypothetical protein|tara:strand:+ start:267 stop:449 length:183 start_codon:yes stop_codon:yes gene_type:complete